MISQSGMARFFSVGNGSVDGARVKGDRVDHVCGYTFIPRIIEPLLSRSLLLGDLLGLFV